MAVSQLSIVDKINQDVAECIVSMKNQFEENDNYPISDESVTLQRFCAKLEFLLHHDIKEKSSVLGGKKGYWDYFCQCLSNSRKQPHDGIRFVKLKSELKSSQGRGRAFIRFCLSHGCLADTLQYCFDQNKITFDWFNEKAIPCNKQKWSSLVSSLYELNDIHFDLSPDCYGLDVSWPTFSRSKTFDSRLSWHPPSRSISVTSLNSQPEGAVTYQMEEQKENSELEQKIYELCQAEADLYESRQRNVEMLKKEAKMLKEIEELKLTIVKANNDATTKVEEVVEDYASKIELLEIQHSSREEYFKEVESSTEDKIACLESEKLEFQNQIYDYNKRVEELEQSKREVEEKLGGNLRALEIENCNLKEQFSKVNLDYVEASKTLLSMADKVSGLSSQLAKTEGNLKNVEEGKEELLVNLEKFETSSKNMKALIEQVNESKVALDGEMKRLKENLKKKSQELKLLEESNTKLIEEKSDLNVKVDELYKSITDKNLELDSLRIECRNYEEKITILSKPNGANQNVEFLSKISDLEAVNKHLREDMKCLVESFHSENGTDDFYKKEIARINLKWEKMVESKKVELDEVNSKLSTFEHYGFLLTPLISQHEITINHLYQNIDILFDISQKLKMEMKTLALSMQRLANCSNSQLDFPSLCESPGSQLFLKHSMNHSHQASSCLDPSVPTNNNFPLVNSMHLLVTTLQSLSHKKDDVEAVIKTCRAYCSDMNNFADERERKFMAKTIKLHHSKNVVAALAKEHKKIQSAEAILKYELQEKRKLLTRLRHELETTHDEWNRVRKKNLDSEVEWKSLREDFAKRHKQASEESGFVEERAAEESVSEHSEVNSTPSLLESVPENNLVEEEASRNSVCVETSTSSACEEPSTSSACEEPSTSSAREEPFPNSVCVEPSSSSLCVEPSTSSDCVEAATSSLGVDSSIATSPVCLGAEGVSEILPVPVEEETRPRSRLEILEEQCNILYFSLLNSSKKSEILEQRLQAILGHHGENSVSSEDSGACAANSEAAPVSESSDIVEDIEGSEGIPLEDDEADVSETTNSSTIPVWNTLDEENLVLYENAFPPSFEFRVNEEVSDAGNDSLETINSPDDAIISPHDETFDDTRKKALENIVFKFKNERKIHQAKEIELQKEIERLENCSAELESKVAELQLINQSALSKDNDFRKRAEFIFRQERDGFVNKINLITSDCTELQKTIGLLKDELKQKVEELDGTNADSDKLKQQYLESEASLNQEVSSLQFQLSTEALKFERALKHYTGQESIILEMREKINQQELLIYSLEEAMGEIKDERKNETESRSQELEDLHISLSTRDEECSALSENLKALTIEFNGSKKYLSEVEEQAHKVELGYRIKLEALNNEIIQLQEDNEELKRQIIKLTRDKDSLWKKSEQLSQFCATPGVDRWVPDNEVDECMQCNASFSFTLRKHHCRLCGRIFCHGCASHWILTAASSRRSRVCEECFVQQVDKKGLMDKSTDETLLSSTNLVNGNSRKRGSSADTISVDSLPNTSSTSIQPSSCREASENMEIHPNSPQNTIDVDSEKAEDTASRLEFDIISDEEISTSLSACSPYSPVPSPSDSSPDMPSSVTRTVEDINGAGPDGLSAEVWINAGGTYSVPLLIDEQGVVITWEFTSSPKSIAFSVSYQELNDIREKDILLKTTKVQSHLRPVQGQLVAKHPGVYCLMFDNHFSKFLAKKISYCLKIQKSRKSLDLSE